MSKELPSIYQNIIGKSKYARFLPEKQRRETWTETVDRFISYLQTKSAYSGYILGDKAEELRQAILNLEIMPSMRLMMSAGEACERDNIAAYNPVSGDTLVVTKEFGNRPISELANKRATVLNKNGDWSEATFTSYGEQAVKTVTLGLNSNSIRKIRATANHRWVLKTGEVVSTDALKIGDKIPFVAAPRAEIDSDYILGIRHGIIYGDGTATKKCSRVNGYMIRLCKDSSELLKYFDEYPVSYPPTALGDPVVMLYDEFSATHDLKALPSSEETASYLLGFLRGWFAVDGSVGKTSQTNLCVTDEGKEWLEKYAERSGWVIQNSYEYSDRTNFGMRTRRQWAISFSRSSLVQEDFLCSWKRENFKELESHFTIRNVEDLGDFTEVFCAEVPDTNTFVLAQGILTGNCSYLAINNKRAFSEALYILMNGTGVGFSCERQEIALLPPIPEDIKNVEDTIVVGDSKLGWAKAYKKLLSSLWEGDCPRIDYSRVRPAGSRLKTFGGRASGPEPLKRLFDFTSDTFRKAVGRKLNSIEVHDLMCMIGEIVVVGGVRRSALISLSNLTDRRMQQAKMGQWWEDNPQRSLANNSIAYTEKPDVTTFMQEWLALVESKSGERGIFNRVAAQKQASKWGRRSANLNYGCNPCSEIILRDKQFCNLSEPVARQTDSFEDLKQKVELATILGTIQSTLTNFQFLSEEWKKNTEEERLLGVSLTGIMDHPVLNGSQGSEILISWLEQLRDHARSVNEEWAEKLGIPISTAITCVKPSGTVSQLVDSASGIHTRHSPFYIRRIRMDKKDPIYSFLKGQGVPVEDEILRPESTAVFSFPMNAPESAIFRNDKTAIEQLELWLIYQRHWCEHKPSVTISVKDEEWPEVGAWVWKHFDEISGVSFLPFSGHTYQQAPYEEISKEEYEAALAMMPTDIRWEEFIENDDYTISAQTLACSASGGCEI